MASALAVGLVVRTMLPTPQVKELPVEKGKDERQTSDNGTGNGQGKKEPEKVFAARPTGWEPVEEAGTHLNWRSPLLPEIAHESKNPLLTALLVYPTSGANMPPFYMLENKITNKVFAAQWEGLLLESPKKVEGLTKRGPWAPGVWKYEQGNPKGKLLKISGEDADRPVLGVTLPEALLVAERLTGKVQTLRE